MPASLERTPPRLKARSRGAWVLAICLSAACAQARAGDSASEGKGEWHLVELAGRPAGYLYLREQRLPEGGWEVRTYMRLRIARGDTPIEITTTATSLEDASGRPLGFRLEQSLAARTVVASGKVSGGKLHIEIRTESAAPRRRELPLPSGTVGLHRAGEMLITRLNEPGDEVSFTALVPELMGPAEQRAVYVRREKVRLGNRESEPLHRVEVYVSVAGGIKTVEWLDDRGTILRTETEFMGFKMVTLRSSREEIAKLDLSSPPEILVSTAVPLRGRLPESAERVVYRLARRKGAFRPAEISDLESVSGQRVLRRDGSNVVVLEVRRRRPQEKTGDPPVDGPDLAPSLAPSFYIQSDDPLIRKLAREAAPESEDSWETARRLARWVERNIRTKDLRTGFATAREVAETRSGDCTEHAVLLAALARARGIPARVVVGLVHAGGAFYGHMWTEVYAGGWYGLDATREDPAVGPDHIGFAVSNLESAGFLETFESLLTLSGNLEIELLESDGG